MSLPRHRFLRAHLDDVARLFGDLPLKNVFSESPNTWFGPGYENAPAASVIRWKHRRALYRPTPFSVFRPKVEERLLARHRERIAGELAAEAAAINRGESVMIAPEGALTPNGRYCPMKSGPLQIIQQASADAVFLPTNLMYDPMTTGRKRAFVGIGPPLRGAKGYDRERYENETVRALAVLGTVTFSHVAGRVLRDHARAGRDEVSEADLKAAIRSEAQGLADRGFHVDPLFTREAEYERRWRRFMAYARREALLERRNGTLRFEPSRILEENVPGRAQSPPWVFCANELDSMQETVEGPTVSTRS